MAYFKPEKHLREEEFENEFTAILFIDTQNYNCSNDGAIYQSLSEDVKNSDETKYFYEKIHMDAIYRWELLQQTARNCEMEVLYTVIQSLTPDGRDRGLDYKISGFHVPPGSWDAQVLEKIAPLPSEIVFPKTSSSVFNSTNIDYVLRNLGITHLILCGCVTDQCVEHAVRDACDVGYMVTLVPDACVTYSKERQEASLKAVSGYCRQRDTDDVLAEMIGVTREELDASCGRQPT